MVNSVRIMKVGIASDHRGFSTKQRLLQLVDDMGHDVVDFGPESQESVDYPDFAREVASAVSSTEVDRGILICGTGIGMCITANKFTGVRAASCYDQISTQMSRLHNDANVLCLSADLLGDQLINRMVDTWLSTDFEGGRHGRRVEKISEIEAQNHLQEANGDLDPA